MYKRQREYLEEHHDEIAAIQVFYDADSDPHARRSPRVTFAELRELADRIQRPPHRWTTDVLWRAYEALEVDPVHPRVRRADRHTVTDLVSLIRFTLGQDNELVPYPQTVHERYAAWLSQQEQAGVVFSQVESWWLDRIADVVAQSAGVSVDDLDNAPFIERGGVDGAVRDLGERAGVLVEQLNAELTA